MVGCESFVFQSRGEPRGSPLFSLRLRALCAWLVCWLGLSSVAAAQTQDVQRLQQAAERKDADAQYELGLAFAADGAGQDFALAAAWLQKAADQGLADAQNALGVMYDNGTGVPTDPAQALAWYQKAADQGHAAAENNLGLMLEIGRGVSLDYGAALTWYRRSAEQGWPAAQANLGLMYAGAVGVARDFVEADTWFLIATLRASGDDQVKYDGLRETVEAKMTVADIVDARQRAREWIRTFERRYD